VRKCVKYDSDISESGARFSCVFNSATLLNIISEQEPAILDHFDWVVKEVINIVKESTGKMRKN